MTFFNRLYYNQCVSTSADRFMLETLKKHADRSRLLALLPKTVQAAHETGDAPGVQNDGGIIYAKENYILVILTDRSVNQGQTLKTINQISSIIYNPLPPDIPCTAAGRALHPPRSRGSGPFPPKSGCPCCRRCTG